MVRLSLSNKAFYWGSLARLHAQNAAHEKPVANEQDAIQILEDIGPLVMKALMAEEEYYEENTQDSGAQESERVVLPDSPIPQPHQSQTQCAEELRDPRVADRETRKKLRKLEHKRNARRTARMREVGFGRKINLLSDKRARLVVKESIQLDAAQLPIARGGFEGKRAMETSSDSLWSLEKVHREGYQVFPWDGR